MLNNANEIRLLITIAGVLFSLDAWAAPPASVPWTTTFVHPCDLGETVNMSGWQLVTTSESNGQIVANTTTHATGEGTSGTKYRLAFPFTTKSKVETGESDVVAFSAVLNFRILSKGNGPVAASTLHTLFRLVNGRIVVSTPAILDVVCIRE